MKIYDVADYGAVGDGVHDFEDLLFGVDGECVRADEHGGCYVAECEAVYS